MPNIAATPTDGYGVVLLTSVATTGGTPVTVYADSAHTQPVTLPLLVAAAPVVLYMTSGTRVATVKQASGTTLAVETFTGSQLSLTGVNSAAAVVPVDATSAAQTLTLPYGAPANATYTVKKTDTTTNAVTVAAYPTDSLDTSIVVAAPSGTGTATCAGSGSWTAVSAGVLEGVKTVTAAGSAQTVPDPAATSITKLTLTAACALTFPTAKAGASFTLLLAQGGSGSYTVTWPGTVSWASGTAPTLTTTVGKTDIFSFLCVDGTNWYGFTSGQAF